MEEIMELICDNCHWPYVCDEDELEERCAECAIEKTIKNRIKEA